MYKRIFTLSLLLLTVSSYYPKTSMLGGNKGYAVSNIPDSLKKNADAVVRYDYGRFQVKNEKRATYYSKYVVTIFNKEGRHYSSTKVGYNKFQSIEEFSGCLYDADGNVIKELDGDNIEDKSAIGESNLYEDDRVKTAELYTDHYPYTVEYIREISYKGYLGWPGWYMRSGIDPVEFSRYEVVLPEAQTLRYWCSVDSIKPVITKDGDNPMYVWEAKNLPLLSKDVYGDYIEDFATIIQIAPKTFSLDGNLGDLTSWNTFGKWIYGLYKDKDKLPPEAVKDVHALITPEDSRREKISKLYKYMQNRTRYVSVQLGIGGFSPFDASYVHEHAYGDCKALSNYMKALLKEAGIESNIVIINSGHERYTFIHEFPSQQFDHVILCVPDPKDTVWLECTSRLHPTGMLGDFTENREALMLTPEGGVVVHTPETTAEQNIQIRKGSFSLDYIGNAESNVSILWQGDRQLDIRGTVDAMNPEERERWVVNFMEIPGTKLREFKFNGVETRDSAIGLATKFDAAKCASVSGTRLFLQPNLMGKRNYIPKDVEKRYSPIRFDNPYFNVDTLIFTIPAGYKPEALPGDVALNVEFGFYHAAAKLINDSTLVYTRSMKINTYEIPAEKYKEYRKFCADIAKADRMQAVFIRNRN